MHKILLALAAALLLTSASAVARETKPAKAKPSAEATVKPAAEAGANAEQKGGIETAARNAFIIDYRTGAVLMDKNAEERMPPASMSKIMTAWAPAAIWAFRYEVIERASRSSSACASAGSA